MLPKAFVQQDDFDKAVKRVEKQLAGQVVRLRYSLDYDSTGDPAVFFRAVMPDEALGQEQLIDSIHKLWFEIEQKLKPRQRWGVYPYYRYRSQSSQERMEEPSWT